MHRILLLAFLFLALGCAGGPAPAPSRGELQAGVTYALETRREDLGQRRGFLLHLPAGWDGASPLPVMVALHGAFMTAAEMERRTGLSRLADEEGFAVLYPEGVGVLGYLQHWNAGFCCGKAAEDHIDDLGFIDICLSQAKARVPLDLKRLYLAGLSNGGMLAYHYALHGRHRPAGVLAVAAGMDAATQQAPKGRSTPLLLVHGLEDAHIPYGGGVFRSGDSGPAFQGQEETAAFWAAVNRCGEPLRRTGEGLESLEWEGCASGADVLLYALEGFGHDWPAGQADSGILDEAGRPFDAGRLFWERFGTEQ